MKVEHLDFFCQPLGLLYSLQPPVLSLIIRVMVSVLYTTPNTLGISCTPLKLYSSSHSGFLKRKVSISVSFSYRISCQGSKGEAEKS